MPTYQYLAKQPKKSCKSCKAGFEIVQRMKDNPLRKCPTCKAPIERVMSLCNFNTKYRSKPLYSDRKLKELGFSKLVKVGKGKYKKIV